MQKVHLHNNRIEELVEQLKALNRKLTALEGQVLRLAEANKVKREDFLQHWRGHELDPAWFERLEKLPGKGWKAFVERSRDDVEAVRGADGAHRPATPACRSPSSAASTPRSAAASAT